MPNLPIIPGKSGSDARYLDGLQSGLFRQTPWSPDFWWIQRVRVADLTLDNDTSTTVSLNGVYTTNTFPTNVKRAGAAIYLRTAFSGGTVDGCTVDLGDAGDVDELLDGVDVFTGATAGWYDTTAGVSRDVQNYESAYAPTLTIITTTGNGNALTAGELWVAIRCFAMPALPGVWP